MKTKILAMAAMGLWALALPASAQIIATSIPTEEVAGTGKGVTGVEKNFAFHLMVAPLAKWKYGEVYINPNNLFVGTVTGTPNSTILLAGEIAFKAGKDWSIGLGGWYNKVGQFTYPFAGTFGLPPVASVTFDFGGDLNLYEGHAGIFYHDFGVQGGVIKTSGNIGTTATFKTIALPGGSPQACTSILPATQCNNFRVPTFTADTTDWDIFGVYKHSWPSKTPVGISLGAGIYKKQGVSNNNQPLRDVVDHTVFSAFLTANIDLYKGLGLDASFWYVNKTSATSSNSSLGLDNQYRFTIGVGYTFSR
jgi:hypothetical protein